jgi:membrane-anchored protein YejM (alkaline phosphatase superfamily)
MENKSTQQVLNTLGIAVLVNAILSTAFMLSVTPLEIWLSNIQTSLFLPASLVAHFSFLFFLLSLITLAAYQLRLRGTAWLTLNLVLFSTLLLVIITNSRVFYLYRFHLNDMAVNLLLGGSANSILSFSWIMLTNITVIILLVVIVEWLFLKWLFRQNRHNGKTCWKLIVVLMLSTQVFYGYKDAVADSSIIMQLRYIPWAQPLTMKNSLRKLGALDTTSTNRLENAPGSSVINYPASPMVCKNKEKLNYLVLMLDSVRFDMLNPEVMPNTYKFSKTSQVFKEHWSTSNSTRFGLFGFFYGLPPTYWFDMLKEQKGSILFDVLTENHYQLHLDSSEPLNSPEFDRTIFSAVKDSLTWGGQNSDQETDTVVINRLLDFLDKDHQENFFAFSFLDAAHGYKLPNDTLPHFQPALSGVNYLTLNNDTDATPFLNLYKSSVYYNDQLLGKVYDKLAKRGLLNNTVVIFTSDHGQEFNDLKQNFWGHNSNFSRYQVKVPLVIHWPEKPAKEIHTITSHEDIIPSLLSEGLNCQNAISDYSTGFSLFDNERSPQQRNLLFANWNNKAIFTGKTYYNFTSYGMMETLDTEYRNIDRQKIEQEIIQEQLSKMSQFLK